MRNVDLKTGRWRATLHALGLSGALAACGDTTANHTPPAPDPMVDAQPGTDAQSVADAPPVADAAIDALIDASGVDQRVPIAIRAYHQPSFHFPGHRLDPDRLLLLVNDVPLPAIDGYRHDGIVDPEGRAWGAFVAGDTTFSVRRGDAPTIEIAHDRLTAGPVTLDDPLISPTPYLEYALEPAREVIFGGPGAYTLKRLEVNYNPTTPLTWRLSVVNTRPDSAVSATLVELDDDLHLVPNGWTAPLFDHLPAGGAIENMEVISPRVTVGVYLSADKFPTTPTEGSVVWMVMPNQEGLPPVSRRYLPLPDGSILQYVVGLDNPDDPSFVSGQFLVSVWECRDPRYKDATIKMHGPESCKNGLYGPGGPPPAPSQGLAARVGSRAGFRGATCSSSVAGVRCSPKVAP